MIPLLVIACYDNSGIVMCAIDTTTIKRSEAQFRSRQSNSVAPSSRSTPSHSILSTSVHSSSTSDVSLVDIMAQL